MAQADELQKIGNQQHHQRQHIMSMNSSLPKDRLQILISGNHFHQRFVEETQSGEGEDDIELSLGLSLNGRFGVDPRAKKLTRSSSIPDFINPTRENAPAFEVPFMSSTNLVRTCSLPTETDEEWRKRKEMQMLRRMEAKRKRTEKQRNLKVLKDRSRGLGEDVCQKDTRENDSITHNRNHQQEQFVTNFTGLFGAGAEGLVRRTMMTAPSPQGSIGSQGSGSSGLSESDNHPVQGTSKCNEARSPVTVQSLSECEQKLTTINGKSGSVRTGYSRSNGHTVTNGAKEMVRNILEDMPCVSTMGDGPNGKRIEGFLYRYRKGEEVRIVCVCHGSFLSPAEFVKHAGGGDVEHPLKHIVVNPYPLV